MRGEYLKTNAAMQRALAEAIAERTGLDADRDMLPVVLAGAVTTASQIAVRRWFAADPPVELRPLVRVALGELALAFTDAVRRIQPGWSVRSMLYQTPSRCAPSRQPTPRSTPSLVNPAFSRARCSATLSTSVAASIR